jgi:molybdate transport system substrate-binding protein
MTVFNLNKVNMRKGLIYKKIGGIMNRKKTFKSVVLGIILALWCISSTLYAEEIMVSAAVSLKNAFEDMSSEFIKTHIGNKVSFNFGASGDLARQIEGGAPVDVFASAAQKDMDDIAQKGFVAPGTRVDFAQNSVVLIQPMGSVAVIESFQDLIKNDIHKIAMGSPVSVPAGRYAKDVLIYFKLWDAIQDKLVYAENVRQVLDYVVRNEVDAGIVYSTDAMTREKDVRVINQAPTESHLPIIYPIAVISGTKNEKTAREFIEFVNSDGGKKILQKYGFTSIQ